MKTFTKLLLAATLFINFSSLIAQTENVPATKNVRNITATSDLSIKGDKLFCTTSNIYTIENLPKGATVHWKVSPKGIAAITSPYSHQTTLNKISDGNVTLTAVVTYTRESVTLKKRVTVGNPFPKGT